MTTTALIVRLVIAAVLVVGFFFYRSHLIGIGEERVRAKDAELVAAKKIHNSEVEARAVQLTKSVVDDLKETLAAPPPADAPHLGCVRPRPGSAGAVSANAAAGPAPAQGPDLSGAGAQDHEGREFDPGPGIDSLLREADATVRTWRAYYYACRDTGICQAPEQ